MRSPSTGTRTLTLGMLVASSLGVAVLACSAFSSDDSGGGGGAEAGPDAPVIVDARAPDAGETGVSDAAPNAWTVLATGFQDLQGIAATETDVFFVERARGIVHAVPIDGGSGQILPLSVGRSPSCIIAVQDGVVVGDYGKNELTYLPFPATGLAQTFPTSAGPIALTAASPSQFLVVLRGTGNVGDIQAFNTPLVPGTVLRTGAANPYDVATNPMGVFWSESAGSAIWSGVIDNADASAPFAGGEDDCESVAADDQGVYWTRVQGGYVRAKATNVNGVVSVATNEAGPFSIASDGSGVYWLTTDGKLRRWTRSTEVQPATIASGFAAAIGADRQVQAIALTTQYVVWLTTDGSVLRLKKN